MIKKLGGGMTKSVNTIVYEGVIRYIGEKSSLNPGGLYTVKIINRKIFEHYKLFGLFNVKKLLATRYEVRSKKKNRLLVMYASDSVLMDNWKFVA